MPTTNLNLPLIDENMTADIPRDFNALAEAVDVSIGTTAGQIRNDIGVMGELTTTDKSSLVAAINELNHQSSNITLSQIPPASPTLDSWWYEDLGDSLDLGG